MAGSVVTIPANNAAIEYTGRIDFANPLAPTFSYSGVSIRTSFTGTSIAAIMDDDTGQNFYNIILDGKVVDTFNVSIGKKTYTLAQGLANTTHEIEIFKRTELTFGKTQFFGFVIDEGATLSAATKRDVMIEYVGNSITCGYGNEGVGGGKFGPTTENHYLTYAAITSRNFNARHLAVCRSGIGIFRNYDGPATGSSDCMTNLYTRTFLFDENPKYSFNDQPDVVCIDLGTNDFSTTGGDSARYVNNYFRLIDTIQAKYSKHPDVICLLGPMLADPTLSNVRRYMTFVADSANKKGKGNVYFFEMSAQTGLGIDYHPNVNQHKKNALELTNYIHSLKGWKIKPVFNSANIVDAKHIKIEFNTALQDLTNKYAGFEIYENNAKLEIDNVYIDTENSNIIHIVLKQSISVGTTVNLSYTPGTITSSDAIAVDALNQIAIGNGLIETTILNLATVKAGNYIALNFNKYLKPNINLEGLTITDSQGVNAVDSFKIVNTKLTLYLKNKIIQNDSVFVSYNGSGIYATDEVLLSHFSKLVVKNTSLYTSLPENEIKSISIYPNPNTTGIFNYAIDKYTNSNNNQLEVYNAKGTLIHNQKIRQAAGTINLNDKMTKGVYFFKLKLGESTITKSIIKK
jgi:hypothetical protein